MKSGSWQILFHSTILVVGYIPGVWHRKVVGMCSSALQELCEKRFSLPVACLNDTQSGRERDAARTAVDGSGRAESGGSGNQAGGCEEQSVRGSGRAPVILLCESGSKQSPVEAA